MPVAAAVHRIEVAPKPGTPDPIGAAVARDARALGLAPASVSATHVYLVQGPLTAGQVERLRDELLVDPVTERATIGSSPAAAGAAIVEVHPLPGVMDPVALSVSDAVRELLGVEAQVATGWRYDIAGLDARAAEHLARRLLANPVIQRVETRPYHPERFPEGKPHDHDVRHIPLINLSDEQLSRLSREAHLFLSLDEMKAVQAHYRSLGREPRDIELETLAQTWSEHCVHKTLKSTVRYTPAAAGRDPIRWEGRPGHERHADGTVTIHNLLKSTVAAATFELIAEGVDWTLSVFKDNSGVVALDDRHGVCIKVETHNHPSAIEPYGGAATGVGGCIRDVIGTGLGAQPIANTDVFCVAFPARWAQGPGGAGRPLPPGTLHPRRILQQVVA
ncbi:MAG: phosphoribosylformylglycinamidine synthase subunit PurS, partial [Phycisphaeraceae bacterium]|nr:phosphoribosylformylglycinamidine synthase subunit PurS [Phycisphaeraceae bacterium]